MRAIVYFKGGTFTTLEGETIEINDREWERKITASTWDGDNLEFINTDYHLDEAVKIEVLF